MTERPLSFCLLYELLEDVTDFFCFHDGENETRGLRVKWCDKFFKNVIMKQQQQKNAFLCFSVYLRSHYKHMYRESCRLEILYPLQYW